MDSLGCAFLVIIITIIAVVLTFYIGFQYMKLCGYLIRKIVKFIPYKLSDFWIKMITLCLFMFAMMMFFGYLIYSGNKMCQFLDFLTDYCSKHIH